jgi:phage baseplate assembly protein W
MILQDAALLWNSDLSVSAVGDIELAMGNNLGQQRVLRRLLTNAGDYLWQPDYGAGLGALVGQTIDVNGIRSLIRSQIFKEAIVARLPEPVIDVSAVSGNMVYVDIRYVDATTGQTQILSFSVGV